MNKKYFEKLFRAWPAKALSLASAIAIFFFYQFNKLEERPLSVPLSVVVNEDFVPSSQYPRTVRLVLRGESNSILSILEDDLKASLDLRDCTSSGFRRVPVKVEKLGSALGIDPLEIVVEPSDIVVQMEEKISKTVSIVPNFRGYLDPGFELYGFKLEPSRIEITGPKSAMEKVSDVTTEPIDLTGHSENFSSQIKLVHKNSLVNIINGDALSFSAEIKMAVVYRSFSNISINYSGLDPQFGYISTATNGTVQLAGSNSELESFDPSSSYFEVNLSDIEDVGTFAIAVVPRFPVGFDVETWSPMVVNVTVFKANESTEIIDEEDNL